MSRARRGSAPQRANQRPAETLAAKGTDLDIGAVRLAIIEDRLNTMPRKLHNWHSAHSVYTALCRNDR